MEEYLKDVEPTWYEKPPNIIGLIRNGITGLEDSDGTNSTVFYYVKGTEVPYTAVNKEQ